MPDVSTPDKSGIVRSYDGKHVTATIGDFFQVLADTNITVHCPVFGVPPPNITWLRNGRPISGRTRLHVSEDGSLTIVKAKTSDRGRYTCIARNNLGEDRGTSTVYIDGKSCRLPPRQEESDITLTLPIRLSLLPIKATLTHSKFHWCCRAC